MCLPAAFRAVKQFEADPKDPLERRARRSAARALREKKVIPSMIERIKLLFEEARDDPDRATDDSGVKQASVEGGEGG